MNTLDFVASLVVAALASAAIYMGWYWLACFIICLFVLIVVNVSLFHMELPQPRYIIGMEIQHDPEEPEKEEE